MKFKISTHGLMALSLCLSAGHVIADDDDGRDVSLADCPAPVRATIEANTRGGRVDEVEHYKTGAQERYVADVDLPGDLDLSIYVHADGTLLKTREDIPKKDYPAFAATLASARGGKVDDVDKEIVKGKTTYRIEVDRNDKPDLDLIVDADGKVLQETEDKDD
ncbi:hypothetical protein ACFQY0_03630 [Haloferula chungangensis]|uniref:PepSY domain-containing protein n=1 Tax=Haloferula chungangensis TaxID=1048331 RepID=A0ABW2L1P8_9BACT